MTTTITIWYHSHYYSINIPLTQQKSFTSRARSQGMGASQACHLK